MTLEDVRSVSADPPVWRDSFGCATWLRCTWKSPRRSSSPHTARAEP